MDRIIRIIPSDKNAQKIADSRWNSIAKPLGGLGLLEQAIEKIAAIQRTADVSIDKRKVVVMCADNGVVCEGVTQSDSFVTAVCTNAIADGTSSINCMANTFGAEVIVVDIGVNYEFQNHNIIDRKIAYGTKNIACGSAMTNDETQKAICVGMDIVRDLKDDGANIIVTGEMGIGNTTTSSALASVLLGLPPSDVTGRGAGLDSNGLKRKINVIERAIAVNKPDVNNPIELISKLGGFDIAGMTGLFLGGAVYHVPIVIDGVISAVSALLACKINPLVSEYILPSHVSQEPAGKLILDMMNLRPIITAQMRLGEGTGGILLLPMLDGALSVYSNAHRFDDIDIERYVELK